MSTEDAVHSSPDSCCHCNCASQPQKDLTAIFRPRSIAVIGASASPSKIGHQILLNLKEGGYAGALYPINPKESEVLGIKAYRSISDIPGELDLAVIAIPAPLVAPTIEECGRKKVKGAAVITSGFGEVGKVAEELQLKELADKNNIALLGPNMFGIVYTPAKINASFGPRTVLPGRIAFISQSGALAIALMGWTMMERIGLASLTNLGNKADIEDKELIEYFNTDENVDVVLIYMEGIKDGRKFMQTKIKKPVVVLKVGRSERGAKAVASHTGSLSGSDKIYDAAFRQLGILRAQSFTEAFSWARAFSLPAPKGPETVIITNGGGIGVRTTDECEAAGIKLMNEPQWTESQFRRTMPDFGSTKNPVDITGQAQDANYRQAAQIAFQDDKIHAVIILYCETVITDPLAIAQGIVEEHKKINRSKPVTVAMVGGERARQAINLLNENGIPASNSVTQAVSSLKVLYTWQGIKARPADNPQISAAPKEVVDIINKIKNEGRKVLMEHEARQVMQLCGIPTPKWGFARNESEAVKAAAGMYPLAMKIASPDIIHKTDVGGVVLNIRNEEELRQKFNAMMTHIAKVAPQANLMGVNLIQMVSGIECIVGMNYDAQFGPVVMFGLGGVFVEVLKDVAFRVVPFGEIEAARMIEEIKSRQVFNGFRGMKADKATIIKTLCAVQKLAPLVKEVDINPLLTNQEGSFAVDARIIL